MKEVSKKAGYVIPDSINFTQPELTKEVMDKRNHDKYVQEQLEFYRKSEKFEPAQEVEIRKGLESGVDVTKYANPDLHFNKMRLIREGLEKGIDASIYLDAGFTDGQLVEILEGAAEGLDVSTYANPKYSKELMFLAQKSLEDGVNDLPKYFDKGYDYNQIVAIYYGKKDGIDTSFYENPKLDPIQMSVIKWGVKYGVDVTKFNNPEIPADKMIEIRDNLIKEKEVKLWEKEGFDIAPYVNKLDCFQLEEIRLGLEKNLDVSVYAKSEYDFEQMEAIRDALEDGINDIAEFINYGPAYSDIEFIEKYIELSKLTDGDFSFEDISANLKPTDNFDAIYDYLYDVEKELEDYDYEL